MTPDPFRPPDPVRPSLPARSARRWIVALATLAAWAGSGAAAEVESNAALRLAFGYDSNPLRISGDGPGGGFADASLDAGVRAGLGPVVDLFFEAGAVERRHASDLDDSNLRRADARAGMVLPRIFVGRSRLSLAVGGRWQTRRSTFTDRETGEIYLVPSDPPTVPATSVAIPERFDSDTTGVFLDLNWRLSRRTRFFLITSLDRTDYVTDYSGTTALEPLDFDALSIEPGVLFQVRADLVLEAAVVLADVEFDEQSALDGNGDPVAGERREYRYADYRVRVRFWPGRQWHLSVGLRGGGREDTFAGYYDYDGWAAFVTADRPLGTRGRFQLLASTRTLDYDAATVAGDPDGLVRGNDVRRFVGRFDHAFHRHVGLFVEGGVQRNESRDPVFAYDRDWALTGLEFRL